MKILNPIKMNDWPLKKFFVIVLSFQFFVYGSIGLDYIGFKIPLLRQLSCFIYISFIIGILAMRVLRLHGLGTIETLLFSIGLSISIIMFTGIFMNTFYPVIGIKTPISIVPLVFTMSFITFFLSFLCYIVDDGNSKLVFIESKDIFSNPSLLLYLPVLLTIIGTYLVNYYSNIFFLMISILLLSLILILAIFDLIPSTFYPFALIVISLSLLYHNSLISIYLSGWDIQVEYFVANSVITNFLWNPNIFSNINSMLSIVMLAPIYSILLKMDLIGVFKIIYPALFSLLSLGLYSIFKKQTNDKIAFISVFFFISVFVFYTEMLQVVRQQIAEYFFMLMMLLIVQNKRDLSFKILLIVFSFSMIVSHYGLSYIVVGSIILSTFLLFIHHECKGNAFEVNYINFDYLSLLTVFLFTWYIETSKSSVLYSIVHIAGSIINNFFSDLFNPNQAQGISIISKKTITVPHEVYKYLHLLTQVLISIGLFNSVFNVVKLKESKFSKEYLSLSLIFYLILLAAIAVPNFASSLNTSRLYHITLILLAPFCIIGGLIALKIGHVAFRGLIKSSKFSNLNIYENQSSSLKIMSLFFSLFLLFNSGWIYELIHDSPTSYSLNETVDYPKFNEKDITGREWLYNVLFEERETKSSFKVYADYYRIPLLKGNFDSSLLFLLSAKKTVDFNNSYIYFSTYNILYDRVYIPTDDTNIEFLYSTIEVFVSSKNKIYNNGGSVVYTG